MIIFLNRLPIPNLKHYCLISFCLFAVVIIYAQKLLHDIKYNKYKSDRIDVNALIESNGYVYTIYKAIINEPWCVWVMINFCYCGILLLSKVIQGIIFGKLRVVENQHIKDQFWNFIFLKFIFIFGVLNLENVNEVIMWCTWFSAIGFLSIHCQICKDRFEYLSFSASTPLKSHIKVLSLLIFIKLICVGLIVVSFVTKKSVGFSIGLFMLAESFSLTLRTLYVISRYFVHLWDLYHLAQWNNKGTITYYIDFIFEMSVVTIDFFHYFHMLIYGNFYLSMASLVICMELKRLFFELKRRMKRHSNYLRVIEKMEKRFPWANQDELNYSDKCAVCWDKLDKARRLPCSHVFHHNCLRSWLEQDTSCPTCRKSLQDDKENQQQQQQPQQQTVQQQANTEPNQDPQIPNDANNPPAQPQQRQPQQQQLPVQRNLFHFDGSRYISWLPSFSLQVTNGGSVLPSILRSNRAALEPERLNEMTEQVRQLFPNIAIDLIQQDLRQTHSVEITVENILEDRLNNNLLNNNTNTNRRNLLNEDLDSDELEDEDEDNSSSDEENSPNDRNLNNTNNPNRVSEFAIGARPTNRRRINLLSSILESFNSSANVNNNAVNTNTDYQLRTTPENDSNSQNRILNETDDSVIINKYSPSPLLSESANELIQKKRELLLSSKKRFLERMNKQSNSATSSSTSSSINENNSNESTNNTNPLNLFNSKQSDQASDSNRLNDKVLSCLNTESAATTTTTTTTTTTATMPNLTHTDSSIIRHRNLNTNENSNNSSL